MNQEYVDTVRLLLAIAPAVFKSPRFALKGGTALNLFLHDIKLEESRIGEYSTWRLLFHAQ